MKTARIWVTLFVLACAACGGGGGSSSLPSAPGAPATTAPLHLVWSDEFNGAAGAPVDSTKWSSNVGGDGWGNNELEYYTNATDPTSPNFTTANARQDGAGHLVISAIAQPVGYDTCWYGACQFTSARLVTLGKFSQQYGRFEVRMKIPPGQGLWPAFWMLGVSNDWPNCGEIDVMEAIGTTPATVYGSAHGPGYIDGLIGGSYSLTSGNLSDDYHVYAVQWQQGQLQYYLDNVLYETITPASMPSGSTWEFDRQPFYIILNLAVGGDWPGPPNASTAFPAQLLVDYVRVYQ